MPPPGLAGYFERALLDHPWADPEIPSLVYLDEQKTVRAFTGSHVRRLSLEGRPIRMACGGQLVSDPAVRNRAAGTLLLRRFFAGPQDLTITDGATEATRRIWGGLGGSVGYLGSINWVRLFDWGAAGEQALERFGMAAWRPVVRPVLSAVRVVANRMPAISLRVKDPSTRAEDLTPQALLEHLPSILQHRLLHPSYDERFLTWLFREMAAVQSREELAKRLIRLGQAMITRMDGERWMGHHLEPFT
jgi:hypothetical protein